MNKPAIRWTLMALGALGIASLLLLKPWEVEAQSSPTLVLAQEPLFLVNRIKPNFIMAVDDSGSMDFEVLLPANDGSAWWNYTRKSFFGLNENNQAVAGSEVHNFNGEGTSSNTLWKKYAY